ncbi:ran exchange factor Prp20/Pim1 [Colletotrichum higginsianum]|uniref:Ran exchange factor Prp20/Pim1 n=1 Tax=Colletotrichum higginsianum (strain IMI 349063) TaxID=759273 RepID=H1W0K8_COLHI|nr:Ran exchange factor Prp20/Pim1 [Colletotrichum higginsianum IMI 349063]OBR10803.1 Ran exchange factor Prp20/Pim1 [Colletotrichum higginsianum IMI 349063]CCF46021.1 ran exchange factor Prp20/Pim1 [Colletotrichum higginsianum]
MPPKAANKKAAAPKASAPKKATTNTAAATKKAAEPTKKTAAKPAAKKDATTNGATAASKRKLAEEEDEVDESADESAEEDEKPATKKTAKKAVEPAAKKTKTTTAAAKKKAAAAEETEDESKTKKPLKKAAVKKAEPKKAAAAKKADTKAPAASKKRKSSEEEPEDEKPKAKKSKTDDAEVDSQATESAKATESADEEPKAEKPVKATKKTVTAAPKPPPAHPHKIGKKINSAPTQILDVYVFGEGSSGELGLGSKKLDGKKVVDVKRPRLNPLLSAKDVGVVQIACGGMHVAALTKDNKILTWGVNDQGALGRDTNWDGGLRDADAEEEEEDEDDSGINPRESTPTALGAEHFAPEAKFTQVVASDSATFALTEDGRVYGWGTFRSSDGILGFTDKIQIQKTPEYLPTLKNITALAAGSNHILALDDKGVVVAWGCGQQNQLGRRIIERNKLSSLIPQSLGIPKGKVDRIACGSYHSFALAKDGRVWAWGLNNFAETGIEMGAGEDDAVVLRPTIVEALKDYKVKQIAGGEHHSLACTEDGKLLTWGRLDGNQVGIPVEELPADSVIKDESNNPRILSKPTVVEDIAKCVYVAAGVDNNFAIDNKGEAHSWGFSANYQTGQGTTEDIETPTTIDNTAVRGKKLVFAGAGGQYSILGGVADVPKVNGFAAVAASQPATGGFRPVF